MRCFYNTKAHFNLLLRKNLLVIFNEYAWIGIVWWLSQIWITRHIFNPKCGRLASTENLFATPFYNSLFIDQSLTMNRRKDETHELKTEDTSLIEIEEQKAVNIPKNYYVHSVTCSKLGETKLNLKVCITCFFCFIDIFS